MRRFICILSLSCQTLSQLQEASTNPVNNRAISSAIREPSLSVQAFIAQCAVMFGRRHFFHLPMFEQSESFIAVEECLRICVKEMCPLRFQKRYPLVQLEFFNNNYLITIIIIPILRNGIVTFGILEIGSKVQKISARRTCIFSIVVSFQEDFQLRRI